MPAGVVAGVVGLIGVASSADQNEKNRQAANERQAKSDQISGEQWDYYKRTYQPLEEALVKDVSKPVDYEGEANRAGTDVAQSFDNVRAQENRELGRYGIDPSSGKFAGMNRELTLKKAAGVAGARTQGRRYAQEKNFNQRISVAGLGRGIPGQSAAGFQRSAAISMGLTDSSSRDAASAAKAVGYGISQIGGTQETPAGADLIGPGHIDTTSYDDDDISQDPADYGWMKD